MKIENEIDFIFNEKPVRTRVLEDGETWFVAKDVAEILGYALPRKAVSDHVADSDKGVLNWNTPGGTQEVVIINEPGLYSLIFNSKLENAEKFKNWVTHEVLPTIRKQGFYTTLTPEETIQILAKGLDYDHFMEDVVFPTMEMQTEFTFNDFAEHYAGYPVKTLEDFKTAAKVFKETSEERRQRLSTFEHCVNDYADDSEMWKKISRFNWNAAENRGHSQKIRGVRWFDNYILEKLSQ